MNHRRAFYVLASVCVAAFSAGCGSSEEPIFEGPYQVPAGFQVESLLPEGNTDTFVQLTFDSLGRPVLSKERDHPRTLFDNDGDGVYETEKIFSEQVSNLQGMWFDGRTLYGVGYGPEPEKKTGLYKLEDTDGDDVADTFDMVIEFTGPMGEHGPHDVRRGPDGTPTILLGNHTFIPDENIRPDSPLRGYKEWQLLERYMDARGHAVNKMAPGGALFRFHRDDSTFSLLLGGFRNPYNHAYNGDGEVFTFDSDMEWDINLPWYREVRSVHAVQGADYGWRTGSGKFPAYYIDTLPPVDDLGRGSPVGVDFYKHYAYPAEYYGAFLQGDWSRGRIVNSVFERSGATYELASDPFDFVYGEPLNVTDVEVGPDGSLYFTMGGRDTSGGFYRVVYKGNTPNTERWVKEGAMGAVRQPQPLSSWGHAALLARKEEMGDRWGIELQNIALDVAAEPGDRVQALHLLQRLGPKPNAELLRPLAADPDAGVRAAAIYVVGQHGSDRAKAIAVSGLKDSDPFVQRRSAEAVIRMGLNPEDAEWVNPDDLLALLSSPDRFVRYAARLALEQTPRDSWKQKALTETAAPALNEVLLALLRTSENDSEFEIAYEKTLTALKSGNLSADQELDALRIFHIACIENESGCRESLRKQMYDTISGRFPHASDERLNREYARTIAYTGQPDGIAQILGAMPGGDENQQLQIHYAYCLREMKTGWSADQKQELLSWFTKARNWRGGSSFPGFINRLFDSSLTFFSDEEKEQAYAAIPEFAPVDPEELKQLLARGGYQRAQVFARKAETEGVSEQELFEYMMYDPMTLKADAARGADLFEEECSKCHRYGDVGKDYGPDLTDIASRFNRKDMVESVLWPSKTISDQYGSWVVSTNDGEIYIGTILSEDDAALTLFLPELERPFPIPKENIKSRRESEVSSMPEGLLDGQSKGRIADLFAYLGQKKGASSD